MEYISLVIFVFSAAMAAGSILLVTRLLEEYPLPFLRSLFYHNLFISAFGFYGVSGIPCVVVFRDGKEVDRIIGYMPHHQFEEAVKKYA